MTEKQQQNLPDSTAPDMVPTIVATFTRDTPMVGTPCFYHRLFHDVVVPSTLEYAVWTNHKQEVMSAMVAYLTTGYPPQGMQELARAEREELYRQQQQHGERSDDEIVLYTCDTCAAMLINAFLGRDADNGIAVIEWYKSLPQRVPLVVIQRNADEVAAITVGTVDDIVAFQQHVRDGSYPLLVHAKKTGEEK